MTRFLYIADTHLGADPMGYQQQKGYPEKLPEILSALRDHPLVGTDLDFILHGGDMIDSTSEDHILTAAKTFECGLPIYLCFGNHDLTTLEAVNDWLKLAPQFFVGGTPNYTVATEDCMVHVVPNHWGDKPFYWERTGPQDAHFSEDQFDWLSRQLRARPDLPHIILTHSPVHGLPEAQTGFPTAYHCPRIEFTENITSFLAEHENVRCMLGAHNHLNMRVDHAGVEFVTASSLVETPFEAKLFEVEPNRIEMSTISLRCVLPFESIYDNEKSFVQGREVDRSFIRELVPTCLNGCVNTSFR